MNANKYRKVEPYQVVLITADGETHRFEEVVSAEVRMVTVQVWTVRDRVVFQRSDVELIMIPLSGSVQEINEL